MSGPQNKLYFAILLKLMIYSAMGKSRSVTVAVAFLMSKYPDLTPTQAVERIREARPIAEPNDGFMAQLEVGRSLKA